MESPMLAVHQNTYNAIFQHPIARNLQWRDVKSMLHALADGEEEGSGNVKFSRNGHTLIVHPPRRKDFSDVQELMNIRRFLETSEAPLPTPQAPGVHLLVVIDHREARIFKTELHGAVPQRITPFDPNQSHRHLRNVDTETNGQRKPEIRSFYTSVAKNLEKAEKILLFGVGAGASSAMEQLILELDLHFKTIRAKVIDAIAIDEKHVSDDQMLAKAREIYARLESQTKEPAATHPVG